MVKSQRQELSETFAQQWQQCRDFLLPFMHNNQPKYLTKDELRVAAMRKFNVSKNAFDMGWMMAIENTGRHDSRPLARACCYSNRPTHHKELRTANAISPIVWARASDVLLLKNGCRSNPMRMMSLCFGLTFF